MNTINKEQLHPIPESLRLTENFGELIIEFDWSRLTGIILLLFSFLWNGLVLFMATKIPTEFLFVLTFPVTVGLFLFYYALTLLKNKTVITCTNDELSIKSGPLPVFGNKKISKGDITQLYFAENITRNKNGTVITYDLFMLDVTNRSKRIIKNLPNTEAASFIESKVEKFYKIKNVAVVGEYRK